MLDSSPYTAAFVYRLATHCLLAGHQFCSNVQPCVSETAEESVLARNESVVTQSFNSFQLKHHKNKQNMPCMCAALPLLVTTKWLFSVSDYCFIHYLIIHGMN